MAEGVEPGTSKEGPHFPALALSIPMPNPFEGDAVSWLLGVRQFFIVRYRAADTCLITSYEWETLTPPYR
jgi:hypothetical protein